MLKASAVDGQPASQRLVSARVVEQARTPAAPFLADNRGKETFLTQPLVILDGMAGVPVVCRRASSKIRRQRAAFTSQPLLLGGELEMNVVGLRWQPGQIAALGFTSVLR